MELTTQSKDLSFQLIMVKIVEANTKEFVKRVKKLIREYAQSLEFDLEFQDFDKEIEDFPGQYGSPMGCLYIALDENQPIGCVALRDLGQGICEMKRLYVKPLSRGQKVGKLLAETVIKAARDMGYDYMRLDTVPSMKQANLLYNALGFKQIAPYRFNPIEGATFFELNLNKEIVYAKA
jgi:ribosomal protein S18 acetylase RimI-like enzyme